MQQTGITPDDLVPPEIPDSLAYVLSWFYELNMGRSGNGFGMNLLSYVEIDAWARLSRRTLSAWEVSVLKMLDLAYVSIQNKKKPT